MEKFNQLKQANKSPPRLRHMRQPIPSSAYHYTSGETVEQIIKKWDLSGIPKCLVCDNEIGTPPQAVFDLCMRLGIEIHREIPRSGFYKGLSERSRNKNK